MKRLYGFLLVVMMSMVGGCQQKAHDDLRVGVIAGPEAELMNVAAKVAHDKGLEVTVVEFSDYTIPNTALNEGSLDANMFQHNAYLQETIKQRHYPLVSIAKTYLYPMGLYSKKIKELSELPEHAVVAIPNDPTNEARALLLLQKAKLIKLKEINQQALTTQAIISNPKQLNIKEMDAAELPRTLDDVSLAAINTNYAVSAGLTPSKDALFVEDKTAPYANLLVVKEETKDDPRYKVLIEALHSKQVQETAKTLFNNEAVQAW